MLSLFVATLASAIIGFANQRGGTCTVAAVRDIVVGRRFDQLFALIEASLWVSGALVLMHALGVLKITPPDYAASWMTIGGAVLFGLGAVINRACLFGTTARLGAGEWAYLATLAGLLAGGFLSKRLSHPVTIAQDPQIFAPTWMISLIVLLAALRSIAHMADARTDAEFASWRPDVAATTIGIAFLVVFWTSGTADYATFLTDIARGEGHRWMPKALLAAALLLGSIVGGWTAGKCRLALPSLEDCGRCFCGGILMGVATSIIPGGNTTLFVLAMPMLWSYAWLGAATICTTIYASMRLSSGSVLIASLKLW